MRQSIAENKRNVELLAPGGSPEGIRACIAAGADAVYTGGQLFGARAYAQNADEQTLKEMIDLCHLYGKKLYLTVNTLLKEEELEGRLYSYMEPFYRQGIDAVLVQDFGVYAFLHEEFPDLPLHASTQMSVSSVAGARLLRDLGFTRIVPARELSLEQIAQIHREVPLEIETFVHGALCYSFSGQCLMSSMIGGRSGNRGRCAQPCRQRYSVNGKNLHVMSLKDICTLDILDSILAAGVCSLKIEGRMKRPEYAAGVTRIYRHALDLSAQGAPLSGLEQERADLMDLYNRGGFSRGYYPGRKGHRMMAFDRPNHAGTPGVQVLGGGKALALEELHERDLVELQDGGGKESRHAALPADVKAGERFAWKEVRNIPAGTVLPRVRNERLLEEIRAATDLSHKRIPVRGRLTASLGEPLRLEVVYTPENGREALCVSAFGAAAQAARGAGMAEKEYEKQLRRMGDTPFVWEQLELSCQEGLFVPVSALNALRREVMGALADKMVQAYRRAHSCPPAEERPHKRQLLRQSPVLPAYTASAERLEQLEVLLGYSQLRGIYADYALLMGAREREHFFREARKRGIFPGLMLPPVWTEEIRETFYRAFPPQALRAFDVLLLRNWQQLGETALQECEALLAADEGIYTWNRRSRALVRALGAGQDTAPAELNRRELELRGCSGSEIPVYGREVMMTSLQCICKNTTGCRREEAGGTDPLTSIRDRVGMEFPVRCMCSICANRIYNSRALDLSGQSGQVLALGPSALRLRFTVETARETQQTVRRFLTPGGGSAGAETTRGHFGRGVE